MVLLVQYHNPEEVDLRLDLREQYQRYQPHYHHQDSGNEVHVLVEPEDNSWFDQVHTRPYHDQQIVTDELWVTPLCFHWNNSSIDFWIDS